MFRVSSAKASDLRKFFSRHIKTSRIDADTLARLGLVDPAGLAPLQLPGGERAALDGRVRACDRFTRTAAEHKVRIKDLVRQLLPMTPLTVISAQRTWQYLNVGRIRTPCSTQAASASPH